MNWLPCRDCPVRTKPAFRQFSEDELAYVGAAKRGQLDIPAREHIVYAGSNGQSMFTLLSGWAFRYKSLPNGSRQILDFALPGDFVGLQSPLSGRVRHGVVALTNVTICQIAAEPVRSVFELQPQLGAALVETLMLDEDRSDRRLLLLGRQRPTQRLAYLFLELHARLRLREMGEDDYCELPLTYEHMSDALGLSRAQYARSLAELRDRGWASLTSGRLELRQPADLKAYCSYDAEAEAGRRALI